MSLYDDLGVRQGATPEQVREQYRVLVRLLHPDQFADPVMKAAAEGQLRRINEIVTILNDPKRHRQHEAQSLAPILIQSPPAEVPFRKIPWNLLAWGTAALACAGAIVWMSGHDAVPVPPPVEIVAASPRFSGVWFYAHRPGLSGKSYSPEFIETHITERNGRVQGHFRSRYRSTNQAVPPSVNFEFIGQAEGTTAEMPLTRDDGGRGEVRLRLISEREMELEWTAAAASSPSPTSGTAILVRER